MTKSNENTDYTQKYFETFQQAFKPFYDQAQAKTPDFSDVASAVEKNIETTTKISQKIFDCSMKVMTLQNDYFKDMFSQAQKVGEKMKTTVTANDTFDNANTALKTSMEKSLNTVQKSANLIEKTNDEVKDILSEYTAEAIKNANQGK